VKSARWPLSPAVIYLAVGLLVGPLGFRLLAPGLREDSRLIESIAEAALALSLLCVGLRLRTPLQWSAWRTPARLATVTLLATIVLIAGAAHVFFDLSFVQALLLASILAPTDPVLASDVHMPVSSEHELSRFSLAAEGGINTGLSLPAVTFSLGLIGTNNIPAPGIKWFAIDIVWAIAAGIVFGWIIGALTARAVTRLDSGRTPDFFEDVIVLASGALAYGGAIAINVNPMLAVLTAGLAICHGGRLRRAATLRRPDSRYVALAQRLERLSAVVVVLLVGSLVAVADVRPEMFVFALLLFAAVRPLAVRLGLGGMSIPPDERRLLSWFGVRGAASVYLLMMAIDQGMSATLAKELAAITLVALVTSIVLHGLSTTPLVSGPLDNTRA
jgi:NhaP-type Na+/H+ or K+/H+ antiporter